MARISSKPALLPLVLMVLLVGFPYGYAIDYGSVTITSAPFSMGTGDEPSVSVHAEWSGAAAMIVKVGLKVSSDYGAYSSDANITSYDANCQSGCQSSLPSGKIDATFSLAAEASDPDASILLYPTSLTVYATLSQCTTSEMSQCTVVAASQPVTITLSIIGTPPTP